MSAIKTLFSGVPAIKRPFRIEDLQNIWDGINALLAYSGSTSPVILNGFDVYDNGSILMVSGGIVAFNGQLYSMGTDVPLNSTIYTLRLPSSARVFADGSVYPFDFDNTVTTSPDTTSALIGTLSESNIASWKAVVGTLQLMDGAVTGTKLAASLFERTYSIIPVAATFFVTPSGWQSSVSNLAPDTGFTISAVMSDVAYSAPDADMSFACVFTVTDAQWNTLNPVEILSVAPVASVLSPRRTRTVTNWFLDYGTFQPPFAPVLRVFAAAATALYDRVMLRCTLLVRKFD